MSRPAGRRAHHLPTLLVGLAVLASLLVTVAPTPVGATGLPWTSAAHRFRVGLTAAAGTLDRADVLSVTAVDFTALFTQAGAPGRSFDPASLAVVEVDDTGAVLDGSVPHQFDPDADYDAVSRARGELVISLVGATAAGTSRHYLVYFDEAGRGFIAPTFPAQVSVTDDVVDEGQASIRVAAGGATWLYQKAGGGFSSLNDADGNDWIGWSGASGAAGQYRGVPNLVHPGGDLHPGDNSATTTLERTGPLRARFRSVVGGGAWDVRWTIYPSHATVEVLAASANYWFMYEGTPGGSLETSMDTYLRSGGGLSSAASTFSADLPGREWAAFTDPAVARSIVLVNHQDDTAVDSYRPMSGQMTVFGFGRSGATPLLSGAGQRFSVGLAPATAAGDIAEVVDALHQPPATTLGSAGAQAPDANAPVVSVLVAQPTSPTSAEVRWTTDEPATSSVAYGTSSALEAGTVQDGTFSTAHVVTVSGLDCATTYRYRATSLDGPGNAATSPEGTFTTPACAYPVPVTITGSGSVQRSPEQVSYAPGTVVTLTAVPAAGASFLGWSGAASGTASSASVTVDTDNAVTANFSTVPPPAVPTLVSDDFNTPTLDSRWTPVDPRGDGTVNVAGSGSGDANLQIVVPAGTGHDAYGANNSSRVMQAVGDTDLELEVKFASSPSRRFQMQGVLLEQDASNWLRFDVNHDGTSTRIFAATTVNGTSKTRFNVVLNAEGARYLRVTRSGNQWTFRHSTDGVSWLLAGSFGHTLTLARAGVFAGNAGSGGVQPPAFTAVVDYVFNTANPVFPEDGVPPTAFTSDDFNTATLGAQWTFVDPRGDVTLSQDGAGSGHAHLVFSLPAGSKHDAWGVNQAPRVMQPVQNSNFQLEARFATQPTQRYQMQGLLVEQDTANWFRFDTHHDGTNQRVFGAVTVAGKSAAKFNVAVAPGTAQYLRLQRSGETWTLQHSADGVTWVMSGSFTQSLTPTLAGVFAGNVAPSSSQPPPATTVLVDYVFDAARPIAPEDGNGSVVDHAALTVVATGSGTVSRSPDRPTYPVGSTVTVTATPAQGATFLGWSGDITSNQPQISFIIDRSMTLSAQFSAPTSNPPSVTVWYGDNQTFGDTGRPQTWVNILGNVQDDQGIDTFTYRLNGGAARRLSIGPDQRRLENAGDFNVELAWEELTPGVNTVTLSAMDTTGKTASKVVTVSLVNSTPTLPRTVDWASATSIHDVAQIVDGKWTISGGEVRPSEVGYDRLLAIGDRSWRDYEVTMPLTIEAVGPRSGAQYSGPALIGLGLRWQGHVQANNEQPRRNYWPTGAFAWYILNSGGRFDLLADGAAPADYTYGSLALGVTYMFKARAQTVDGGTRYQFKWWPQGSVEPSGWMNEVLEPAGPATGSVLLVVHHFQARIGNIQVTPL